MKDPGNEVGREPVDEPSSLFVTKHTAYNLILFLLIEWSHLQQCNLYTFTAYSSNVRLNLKILEPDKPGMCDQGPLWPFSTV